MLMPVADTTQQLPATRLPHLDDRRTARTTTVATLVLLPAAAASVDAGPADAHP